MNKKIQILFLLAFMLCGCSNNSIPVSQDDVEYVRGNNGVDFSESYANVVRSETNAEIIVHLVLSSGSDTPVVKSLEKKNGKIVIHIDSESKGIGTCDMAYWTITIDSSLEYVGDINNCFVELKPVFIK